MFEGLAFAPLLAFEGLVGGDDLAHGGLDAREVVFAEPDAAGEVDVVVEAVFDDGTDAQLAARVEPLDGFGQDVRRRVTHHVQL